MELFIVIMTTMKLTVPNIITTIRLAAIPFMAYYIYASVNISEKYNLVAFILFLSIWATDVLDGYIARRFNQISDFGKLFDPFVDKLFHFATALTMAFVGKIPYWVPLLIFLKELFMIIGGTVLFKKYRLVVYSKWYGKLATILFVLAFSILFFLPPGYNSGYLFILPLIISFYAYIKYGFDNVIPVLYHKSKRHLDSETIASENTNYRAVRINKKNPNRPRRRKHLKRTNKYKMRNFRLYGPKNKRQQP